MIITRYAHQVEIQIEGQRKLAIDVERLTGAALATERRGGRMVNALVLLSPGGEQRIEGGAAMLAALHQSVVETMTEIAEDLDETTAPSDHPTAIQLPTMLH